MTNDDLDRALADGGAIVPSSGFVSAVMNAVQAEATTVPPIPFPWRRALAGLAIGLALIVSPLLWWIATTGARGGNAIPSANPLEPVLNGWKPSPDVLWAAGSLVLAYATATLSRRLFVRS